MDQTEQLLNLKRDIDNAKTNIAKGEGKKEALIKELKEQWQCTTIKQAEKQLENFINEAHKLNNQIEKGVTELERKYTL